MKRFVNRARAVRPRIIETTYRVVRGEARRVEATTQAAAPLTPASSFAELAAKAYAKSRERGADAKVNAVA